MYIILGILIGLVTFLVLEIVTNSHKLQDDHDFTCKKNTLKSTQLDDKQRHEWV